MSTTSYRMIIHGVYEHLIHHVLYTMSGNGERRRRDSGWRKASMVCRSFNEHFGIDLNHSPAQ